MGGGRWSSGGRDRKCPRKVFPELCGVFLVEGIRASLMRKCVCACVYPETRINHAGDEQMKSMIPETSSGINWRDHVRDVSSNWHRRVHPSQAGSSHLPLCLPLTPGCTPQFSFLSQPITGFPSSPGQGRFVSSPQPASARESIYSSAFTLFICALSSSFPLFSLWLFISLRSFLLFPSLPSIHTLQK